MAAEVELRIAELDREIRLASLKAHQTHMRYIYSLRGGALGLSALTIIFGAVMTFSGLQGSFDWAIESPNTIGAKLTNASPGIVFATVGLLIAFVVVCQKPVNFSTGGPRDAMYLGRRPDIEQEGLCVIDEGPEP